ncbi:MAG TPA: HD-GYP domain-containing protein [Lacipirellulaceae bacterium]|jgi:HD-GYP domain-containing protein (c-di-GMP phosphodiesterase class II)|nr:HD-GYP domain-containing protein [Lacipirellulaceae bacterium]
MATIIEQTPRTSNSTAGYLAVPIAMLHRLRLATVDLFVQYEPGSSPVLYHRAGCPIEAKQLSHLAEAGVQHIFVRTEDFQQFGSHLLESVDSLEGDTPVPAAERFAVLQVAVAMEIERTSRLVDCGPYVTVAEKVGRDLTSLLSTNKVLPKDLFRLARHDFNTFTHVTNVAGYSVILAERLGLISGDGLEKIATAAILHDIGKRFIPAEILTKPSRLDPHERDIIETHPVRGYEELCERPGLTHDQLMIVYQHHERIDGTGYPVGIQGDEIHPWARMLSVVDVFDAMTGTRPYRRPATAQEAMNYIRQNAGTQFDSEVVQCWTSLMTNN